MRPLDPNALLQLIFKGRVTCGGHGKTAHFLLPIGVMPRLPEDRRAHQELTVSFLIVGAVFDRGMLSGDQDPQGHGIAANKRLPPIRLSFGDFIIEPTIGVAPTYFDLLAAPRTDRRRVFPRALNPFNKLVAPVAFEADHLEERIARIRIMGEWQRRPGERNIKNINRYQIVLPRFAVDIDLQIERLCVARQRRQGAPAAEDVVGAIRLPSFSAPLYQGRHKTDAKSFGAQRPFVPTVSDFNQMKGMRVPAAPLLRQFGRRSGDAERASDVVGAAQRQDANRYRSVRQMREDVAYCAVAAGRDDNIACMLQSTLQVVVFGRYIIDLYAGKTQC